VNWDEANRAFYDSRVWTTLRDRHNNRILKYPTDLYVYEEIIRRTKPDVIVETGSFEGGSAGWFAQFAGVISVDIRSPKVPIPSVVWVEGDSVMRAKEVARLVDGQSVLVSLDSSHTAAHVLAELRAYAPIATEYIVVEDTAIDVYGIDARDYPDGGPGKAAKTWLARNKKWAPDPECDRFMLGMNPGGWLRRVA